MGKHSKPNPKKISFFGSTAGAFGALVLAVGIFTATSLSGDSPTRAHPKQVHPEQTQEPVKLAQASGALEAVINPSIPNTVAPGFVIPTTETLPVLPVETPGPTVKVDVTATVESHAGVNLGANVRVTAPPAENASVGVDTDVQTDVPLLGQAVDTVTDVTDSTLNGLNNLLSN